MAGRGGGRKFVKLGSWKKEMKKKKKKASSLYLAPFESKMKAQKRNLLTRHTRHHTTPHHSTLTRIREEGDQEGRKKGRFY